MNRATGLLRVAFLLISAHGGWFFPLGIISVSQAQPRQKVRVLPLSMALQHGGQRVAIHRGERMVIKNAQSGAVEENFHSLRLFPQGIHSQAVALWTEKGLSLRHGKAFKNNTPIPLPKVLSIAQAAISANSQYLALLHPGPLSAHDADTLSIWDIKRKKWFFKYAIPRGRGLGITFSPDGKLLALFGDHHRNRARLTLFSLTKSKAHLIFDWQNQRDQTTYCAAFSPANDRLALCSGTRILVWSIRRSLKKASKKITLKLESEVETSSIKSLFPKELRSSQIRIPSAHQVAFNASGSQIATLFAFLVRGVALWDVKPLSPRRWIKPPLEMTSLRQVMWSKSNQLLLLGAEGDHKVWLESFKKGQLKSKRSFSF